MAAANGIAPQGGQEDVRTAIFKTLYPEEFLKRHLEEHVREDGRGLLDHRPASVSTSVASNAQGSALVRFGTGTLVMAGVQAHISEPHHERPNEGFLVPNVDVSPICSPQFKAGPPSEGTQAITHGLQRFLNTSGILSRKSLCIEPGAAVWTLYLDVVCISADGGILDAAALAAVAALADCKLPKASFDVDTRQCVCDAAEVNRLPLAGLPTLVSFGIYESTYLLADPSAFEASLSPGRIHIGLTDDAEKDADVFTCLQLGDARALGRDGKPLENERLVEFCIGQARTRADVLRRTLQEARKQ